MSSEIIRLWMPDPLEETADTLPPATVDEAQLRAASIRAGIERFVRDVVPQIAQAYLCRDWAALGYRSWEAYVRGEYGLDRLRLARSERQEAVGTLRVYGMSTRAIGTALGVDQGTVRNDLATVPPAAAPVAVVGADGKRYEPTRPAVFADVVDAEIVEPAAPAAAGGDCPHEPPCGRTPCASSRVHLNGLAQDFPAYVVSVDEPAAPEPVEEPDEPAALAPAVPVEVLAGSTRIAVRAQHRQRGGEAVYVRLVDADRDVGDVWRDCDSIEDPVEVEAELNERELDELIDVLVAARAQLRRLRGAA